MPILGSHVSYFQSLLATTYLSLKQLSSEQMERKPNFPCHVFRPHSELFPP